MKTDSSNSSLAPAPPKAGGKTAHIRDNLLRQIGAGELHAGARLPGERQLAERFDVSHMTARQAVSELVDSGLVERRGRRGTFVREDGGSRVRGEMISVLYLGFGVTQARPLIYHAHEIARSRGWAAQLIRLDNQDVGAGVRAITGGGYSIVLADQAGLAGEIGRAMQAAKGRSVLVGNTLDGVGVPSVMADDAEAMRLGLRHLLSRGHRRIGLVFRSENRQPLNLVDRTYFETLRTAFVGRPEEHVADDWLVPVELPRFADATEITHEAVVQMLRRTPPEKRATALLCSNDDLAIGTIAAARDEGVQVPDDLAIVSFGNTGLARMTLPDLTSLDVDYESHVLKAFEFFDHPGKLPLLQQIKPTLIERGSS